MKRIYFLLLILLLASATAEAQYTYSLQVKTNTGGDVPGTSTTYLSASTTAEQTRTRTRSSMWYSWGSWSNWSNWTSTNTPTLLFSNSQKNAINEGGTTETPQFGATTQTQTKSGTIFGSEWVFEPVDYKTEGDKVMGYPGWYHIRNTGESLEDLYLVIDKDGKPALSTSIESDSAMWRLIKMPIANETDVDNMYFKLVSKAITTYVQEASKGTLIYLADASTTTVSASYEYGTANSVFHMVATNEGIVKNDDQEIISNEAAANSENVWNYLPPTVEIDDEFNLKGGNLFNPIEGDYYTLVPIDYAGSREAYLMYGHEASGGYEGDGYYFSRMPAGTNFYQNLNKFDVNNRTVIVFTVWVRAIIENASTLNTDNIGNYIVGKAKLAYSAGDTLEIDITVPKDFITDPKYPNDPEGWYGFARVIYPQEHGERSFINVRIENTMQEGSLLDSDNIVIETRSEDSQAVFNYKHSGSPQQARQNVHEYHQTIYTKIDEKEPLTTSTSGYAYYRWYKIDAYGLETRPSALQASATTGSTQATMSNGIMYFNTNKTQITRGYQANYDIVGDDFFNSDASTIYCDISNYNDFTWSGNVNNNTGEMYEPTVSLRNVFHLRPASEIADSIDAQIGRGLPLEYYEVESPTNIRLRLTPQYIFENYFANVSGVSNSPQKGTRFSWRSFTPDQLRANPNFMHTVSTGTTCGTSTDVNSRFSFPSGGSNGYKYLQVNGNISPQYNAGDTIYFAVDLATTNNYTAQKRIAVFRVVYKDKADVGPKLMKEADIADASKDIFASITEKKLIITRSFDQMETAPATLPEPFPIRSVQGNYSVYRMGVKPLGVDESNYGFTNPLHYDGNGVATSVATGTGRHLHHQTPYWSEYGFPQEIRGDINGYSWWNNNQTVYDITYLKGNKKVDKGNMLYIDAAEQPGVVAALNFNESFCAGAKLYFSTWIVNLNEGSGTSLNESGGTRPNLVFVLKVIDQYGKENVVKRFYTGDIGYQSVSEWHQIGFDFVIPSTLIPNEKGEQAIDFRLEIQNNGLSTTGNDFAIDEINVFRTNPTISAVRTNSVFCMPESGEVGVTDDLTMQVEVNLSQLWPDGLRDSLYFRFLDARGVTFPAYQDGKSATTGKKMYINMGYYTGDENYDYGVIAQADFKNTLPDTNDKFNIKYFKDEEYGYMSYYNQGSAKGDVILEFSQRIPTAVLNDLNNAGDFNTGIYAIYVGESDASILLPRCAGNAAFKIQFDATEFEMTVGGVGMGETGSMAICTNNDVDVKAYATDPNTEERLFAYYDWFYGPLNTQPFVTVDQETSYNAREFTYKLKGNYPDSVAVLLYDSIDNAPVINLDGFNKWLASENGEAWLGDENYNGPNWAWGMPNYVGFNQYGGYFRHTLVPGAENAQAEKEEAKLELDAVTSATRIGHDDNKETIGETPSRPVSFRTLKKDLAAYRFFYPYEPNLPETEVTEYPVDPTIEILSKPGYRYVDSIDYRTGAYYLANGDTITKITEVNIDDIRFTDGSYSDTERNPNKHYLTNYVGQYIDADGKVLPNQEDTTGRVPYIKDFQDFQLLLARMRYWEHRGYVTLYKDRIPEEISSLANTYLTVIPTDVAFKVADLDVLAPKEMGTVIPICTTPTQIALQAESWSPDSWAGQVSASGKPDMPYFDIEDQEYIYTVRLPERMTVVDRNNITKEIRPTEQFVLPMLYLDEIRSVRVRLADVKDETGESVINNKEIIIESYFGLIDTIYTNRLDTGVWIPIDRKYVVGTDTWEKLTDDDPKKINARWQLTANRGPFLAFESYPLVYNSYQYFVKYDPNYEHHEVTEEGDPLPIGAVIKTDNGEFVVNNNNIGIEVVASDTRLREFVIPIEEGEKTTYHFRPGYTYDFVLEASGNESWRDESNCDLSVDFRLKVVPDTVIWGGTLEAPSEWNLDGNWFIPEKEDGKYTEKASTLPSFPPLPQTKVIIPASLAEGASYPSLEKYEYLQETVKTSQDGAPDSTGYDPKKKIIAFELITPFYEPQYYGQKDMTQVSTTPFIEFDYNYVPNACDTIHFKEGSELGWQSQLEYTYAKVDLRLNTDQWYGLSAPLRHMYSGDYIFDRQNPLVEMRLHHTKSPQTGADSTSWTQPFHNVVEELGAASGFSARIGKIQYPDAAFNTDKDKGIKDYSKIELISDTIFHFPSSQMTFDFYDEVSKVLTMKEYQKLSEEDREFGHRFVYEKSHSGESMAVYTDTLIRIPLTGKEGQSFLVGNPFMSHIDFQEFYRANRAVIQPQYKVLSGGNQYITLNGTESFVTDSETTEQVYVKLKDPGSTKPEDADPLTWLSIPPMQSFIVEIRGDGKVENLPEGSELIFTGKMGVIDPARSQLRSDDGEVAASPMLTITASTADHSSKTLVVLSEKADNRYHAQEDSRVMLIEGVREVPKVFTVTEGMYLDINRMWGLPKELPIGISTDSKLKTTLTLSGFLALQSDYDEFFFKDAQENVLTRITGDSFTYTFDNKEGDQLGRFSLISSISATGLEELSGSSINVHLSRGVVYVTSMDGSEIRDITITRVGGEVIHRQMNTGRSQLEIPVGLYTQEVLLVKARTEKESTTAKLLNK
ncbi:hypothetical protein M2480_001560 [Parabacteroides sp. PFB2-12]|uniref:hypothetical protein n=1 Tax=unclassified Parabacteroides TaxID=2649774 RepID=UPI0024746DDA|nr:MULTISPECIES: hypothetical protein [unclassified Parabacteroides]MDH6342785.1 hypothetical protein [Parabacteroides sp. PM6-13]MDH6390585.1 hypothetical protein [Parabacteroides sp. PFB2-12]